jgi:Zn-dependent protease
MRSSWLQLGRTRVLGARVYVHWSVVAVAGLLAFVSFKSPIHAAVSIAAYFGVIVIHELGHALMARRLGYAVGAIHIGFLHGRCEFEAPYTERDDVLIAWAGVAAQFAVAVPILIIATAFEDYDFGYAAPAIVFLGHLNVMIALVNLAPAPGLDGGTAWRAVPLIGEWWKARKATKRAVTKLTRGRRW